MYTKSVKAIDTIPTILAWLGITKDIAHPDDFNTIVNNLNEYLIKEKFTDFQGNIICGSDNYNGYFPDIILEEIINWLYNPNFQVLSIGFTENPNVSEKQLKWLKSTSKKYYGYIHEGYKYRPEVKNKWKCFEADSIGTITVIKNEYYTEIFRLSNMSYDLVDELGYVYKNISQIDVWDDNGVITYIRDVNDKFGAVMNIKADNFALPNAQPDTIVSESYKPHIVTQTYTYPNVEKPKNTVEKWYPYNPKWADGDTQNIAQKIYSFVDTNYLIKKSTLTSIADTVRAKGRIKNRLIIPSGVNDAINALELSSDLPELEGVSL